MSPSEARKETRLSSSEAFKRKVHDSENYKNIFSRRFLSCV
jgi:hypothetical protein